MRRNAERIRGRGNLAVRFVAAAGVLTCASLVGVPSFVRHTTGRPSVRAAAEPGQVTYVPGSTSFACYLVGFPQSSTRDDYGVEGNGLGYSFTFDGKTWWLFGDTHGTATFDGYPNKLPRYPKNKALYDNDSIATSAT
ncbi:MAG TPA: hypothetical protein VMD59_16965, partial [Acidimicrobiales bacterium]|nr:hypothetical protein [Acidimicrobiales bacterium]